MKIIRAGRLLQIRFADMKPELVGKELTCKTCGCVFEPEADDSLKPKYDLPSSGTIGYVAVCPVCLRYCEV